MAVAVVVSAIIPTFNRADLVSRAIRGALEQQVPNGEVEVIVVDDESTDNTEDVVRAFESVTYLRQPNRKEGAARNTGAAHAQGTYLAFCDSDDYWLPGKLASDVARFESPDGPALIYSRAINVDQNEASLGVRKLDTPQGDVFWALAREAFMPMSSVAVRADAFRECGGFNEDARLSGTADWEFWLRMAARWPVGFVDQTRTCIRVHASSMLATPRYMEPAMLSGVDYALRDPVVAQRARGREGFLRACMYVTLALHAYRHRDRQRSLFWLGRALATWPAQALDPRFLGAAARALLGPTIVSTLRRTPLAA
jgi:cellulose synthase/poly-beta-1,6-N-acetylglucosamine synthase-like glycosyltransferase